MTPDWLRRLSSRMGVEGPGDLLFKGIVFLVALSIVAVFAALLFILIDQALPAIRAFGLSFLLSRDWNPDAQEFGALPYVLGTLVTSILAIVIALPIAIGTAIALTELLPRRIAAPIGLVVELLAAIPSIIFGVWGVATVVPWVQAIGGERTRGPSLLAAGIVLAVMILPIVTAITRDMLRAVPRSQREAALALGLTRWEVTWRIVLPNARGGTTAAVILGFGRAFGETMAVIMVVGNIARVPTSIFDPGSTIASLLANEASDPSGELHYPALVELGLILLLVSLTLNLIARAIVRKYERRVKGTRA